MPHQHSCKQGQQIGIITRSPVAPWHAVCLACLLQLIQGAHQPSRTLLDRPASSQNSLLVASPHSELKKVQMLNPLL